MEEIYSGFADVYDSFMEDVVPYDSWASHISKLIRRYGVTRCSDPDVSCLHRTGSETGDKTEMKDAAASLHEERDLVVDLACGTGNLTFELKNLGYDVMGIDISPEMLMQARAKAEERSHGISSEKARRDCAGGKAGDILFLNQDMRELDMYCTAGTFVCTYDAFNYLLTDDDVLEVLKRVNTFLYPGGLFIFDFNTVFKYRDKMGKRTFVVHLDEEEDNDCLSPEFPNDAAESEGKSQEERGTLIWENTWYDEGNINESDLTFFVREDSGFYRRFTEQHLQRGFTMDEMISFLEKAGLSFVAAFDDYSDRPVTAETGRILMIAREHGKPEPV